MHGKISEAVVESIPEQFKGSREHCKKAFSRAKKFPYPHYDIPKLLWPSRRARLLKVIKRAFGKGFLPTDTGHKKSQQMCQV